MPKVSHCHGKREDTETSRYIGRPTIFGNPFPLRREEDRRIVLQRYTEYFYKRIDEDEGFRTKVLELRGYDLACWCAPRACHGDIILAWLETHTPEVLEHYDKGFVISPKGSDSEFFKGFKTIKGLPAGDFRESLR